MKKIMFNDRYRLTQAVIKERKTMTRRMVCKPHYDDVFDNSTDRFNKGWIDHIELIGYKRAYAYKPKYKVGEIVAVAQSYETVFYDYRYGLPIDTDPQCGGIGFKNKMYVKAEYMPHQIRITGVRAERLQDITDEDCLREGVCGEGIGFFVPGIKCRDWSKESHVDTEDGMTWKLFPTRRAAFASLIDKVSVKGTWERNPWVWAYEFEFVK